MNDDRTLRALAEVVKYEYTEKIKEWTDKVARLEDKVGVLEPIVNHPVILDVFFRLADCEEMVQTYAHTLGPELTEDENKRFQEFCRQRLIDKVRNAFTTFMQNGEWAEDAAQEFRDIISERKE